MSETFVVSNQLGQYWGKKKRWVDGTDAKKLMTVKHQDEGVNLLVELGSKDIELRGEVLEVEANDRGVPIVVPSEHLIAEQENPFAQTPSESLPLLSGTPEGSDPELDQTPSESLPLLSGTPKGQTPS